MRADSGGALRRRPPALRQMAKAVANLLQVLESLVELVRLPPDEITDVRTRRAARALDADDLLDLTQPEAEPLRLTHESEQPQRLGVVHAVAGRRAARRGQDARRLVEPHRLSRRSAPGGELTDEQAVSSHTRSVNPAPRVKVKTFSMGHAA